MIKRLSLALVAVILASGCTKPAAPANRPRLISYSPSVTDILYDLGLGAHVAGVTSWCILPTGESKPVVGSESAVNTEAVLALEPDLIFVQQDPSKFDKLLQLRPACRVVNVKTDSVDGVLATIRTIGREVGRQPGAPAGVEERAGQLADAIRRQLDGLRDKYAAGPHPRVLFAMGFDHPHTGGTGTYLDEVITLVGGVNAAAEKYAGWKTITAEAVLVLAPDVIICQVNAGEEGAARKYWEGLATPAARNGKVFVSTDRRLTFFSSRLGELAAQFAGWIHGPTATRPATEAAR